ncbi:hypothetical protein MASR1M74_25100 [Lentimicrobium sp.]
MEKYKGKYRIESNRLKGWDYSSEAIYFITIVTQNRECNLGKIINGEMALSEFGKLVKTEWLKSFDIRDELVLDEYIIMPNHLHAIVIIQNVVPDNGTAVIDNDSAVIGDDTAVIGDDTDVIGDDTDVIGDITTAETHDRASLLSPQSSSPQSSFPQPSQSQSSSPQSPFPPPLHRLPKSISSFVGGFKSAVNSKIDDYIDEHQLPVPKYNRNNHFFQPNYTTTILYETRNRMKELKITS